MYVTINYNMYTICIRNTARSKTIPLMCTHVYSYMFNTVHPPRSGCDVSTLLLIYQFYELSICVGNYSYF